MIKKNKKIVASNPFSKFLLQVLDNRHIPKYIRFLIFEIKISNRLNYNLFVDILTLNVYINKAKFVDLWMHDRSKVSTHFCTNNIIISILLNTVLY